MAAVAAEPPAPALPSRIFYADARVSFTIPDHWSFDPDFPQRPLLSRETPEGGLAQIHCELLDTGSPDHWRDQISPDELRDYARADLAKRAPKARVLAAENRTLAGRNAFEVTCEESQVGDALQRQVVYLFAENRYIAFSLAAGKNSFPWQVPEFQKWLAEVQTLSRRESGALNVPSHGGLWIHAEGGARVPFPDEWLVGVANDHLVGAALVRDEQHSEITVTLEPHPAANDLDAKTKASTRADFARKDWKIAAESEEPFHGYPAWDVEWQGYRAQRFVRGRDIWVVTPKARWLISLEADGSLSHKLEDDYRRILAGIEFQ